MYGSGDLNIKTAALINKLRCHSLPLTVNTVLSQIERADVNDAGEWWGGRALTRRERRAIAQAISSATVRCKAEALQLAKPYTHLITIEGPRSGGPRDEVAGSYLVATADLPAYDSIRDPFVILRGEVNWKDRLNVFEGASAVVVPSISEPFGLVVLEAMQSGVPVVYPYECGAAEVVREAVEKVFRGSDEEWKSKNWLAEMQFRSVDAERVDAKEIAERVSKILNDQVQWEGVVQAQIKVVRWYVDQAGERTVEPLQEVWREVSH
jgi:glycosyltransferase involved in cell wall biosynthesis